MGRRGPKAKKAELEIIQGNPTQRAPKQAPKRRIVNLKPPIKLTRQAAKIFRDTCTELEVMNLLSNVDANLVARYAIELAEYFECQKVIEAEGYGTLKTGLKGTEYFVYHPEVTERKNLRTSLAKMERELGLTPNARAALQVATDDEEDDGFDEFMEA